MILTPRLDILPAPQYRLWPELIDTPKHFVLYGGTAIALRLGHRQSIDFDFFSSECFHPSELLRDIPYLKDAMPILSQNNSLVCAIDRGGTVKLSFFGGLSFGHIQSPDEAENTFISVASLLDLMASKLKVIQDRAEYKDYFDLYTLLQHDLFENGLGAAQAIYGASFNPLLSLKASASVSIESGIAIMKKLSLEEVVTRVIWWKSPQEALKYKEHLIAHAMAHGRLEDILVLEKTFGVRVFQSVLKQPPPGIFDEKSWVFWRIRFNLPWAPLPKRALS